MCVFVDDDDDDDDVYFKPAFSFSQINITGYINNIYKCMV